VPGAKRHPTLGLGVVVGAGAKVLGGFTVGDGARIGSNAVVVKEVPAGATAVGNPARILLKKGEDAPPEPAARRAARAMAFSAYGLGDGGDDPLAKALHGLIDISVEQQQQIERLQGALQRAGVALDAPAPAVPIDPAQLNRLVDE
jgi:serine O-acetyltransferase